MDDGDVKRVVIPIDRLLLCLPLEASGTSVGELHMGAASFLNSLCGLLTFLGKICGFDDVRGDFYPSSPIPA